MFLPSSKLKKKNQTLLFNLNCTYVKRVHIIYILTKIKSAAAHQCRNWLNGPYEVSHSGFLSTISIKYTCLLSSCSKEWSSMACVMPQLEWEVFDWSQWVELEILFCRPQCAGPHPKPTTVWPQRSMLPTEGEKSFSGVLLQSPPQAENQQGTIFTAGYTGRWFYP